MDDTAREGFYRSINLYNRGEYLECQPPLEAAYREAEEEDKPLLRALIALACAMHLHFNHGGGRGVENLLRRSLLELDEFPPAHLGVDVEDLNKSLTSYLEELGSRRKAGAGFFDRWLAPRIRYRNSG